MLAGNDGVLWTQNRPPEACTVLCGINEMNSTSLPASTLTNLTYIYRQLQSNGILPILCTIPPRNGFVNSVQRLNNWIARYAREHGLPLVDFYSLLVNPTTGNYQAAYDNGDGIHPSPAGAQAMGQLLANTISGIFPFASPWLAADNIDQSVLYSGTPNPLLITDTNLDNVPDNCTGTGAGAVFTLAADAAMGSGKAWGGTSGAAVMTMRYTGQNGLTGTSPGDRMYAAFRVKHEAIGAGGALVWKVVNGDFSKQYGLGINTIGFADNNWRTMAFEWYVPAAQYNITGAALQFQATAFAGSKISIGQVTLVNLTAMGIDSSPA